MRSVWAVNYQTTPDLCSYHFIQPTLFQHFQQMHFPDYIDNFDTQASDTSQAYTVVVQYITSHINIVIIPEEDGHPGRKVRITANGET
jgi:hypothetical protein